MCKARKLYRQLDTISLSMAGSEGVIQLARYRVEDERKIKRLHYKITQELNKQKESKNV